MAVKTEIHEIELSHFRAEVVHQIERDHYYTRKTERKHLTSDWTGEWSRAYTGGVIRGSDLDEVRGKMQEHNKRIKRQIVARSFRNAFREVRAQERKEKRKAAKNEYSKWLETLPLDAVELYREDPASVRYKGGEEGGTEKRSMTDFLDLKAREHWPEQTAQMKQEIRERHGVSEGTMLV